MKVLYCNKELIKYHMAEALVMAGLPMSTTTEYLDTDIRAVEALLMGCREEALANIFMKNEAEEEAFTKRLHAHMRRGHTLGQAAPSSGHDSFLKGIVVTAVISAPAYQWPQIQRYHFLDIVNSQSKMHRLTKMDIRSQCNEEVSALLIDMLNAMIDDYNQVQGQVEAINQWRVDSPEAAREKQDALKAANAKAHKIFRAILNNTPHGLRLAAGITTNYLQLKTMKQQRRGHRLEEWYHDFVDWVDDLPYFLEFTEKTGIKKSR